VTIGSGGIKPCVSANVGDQFGKANGHRLRAVYQIFYFSINFGSFFATLLIPFLRSNAGAWVIAAFPALAAGVSDSGELAQEMVGAGLARVYSFADNRQCVAALVAAERAARHSALGLWRDPYYLIRAATDPALAARHDSYDLVEGRVLSVGERGPIVYLDFGLEWSTDFTVVLGGEATAALAEAGWQVGDFKGRRIRVRGWVEQQADQQREMQQLLEVIARALKQPAGE